MVYSFASFRLDLRTRELRLGDEVVSLGPKPFDLLALLVSRRGAVVTKDDLYATLWPDTHVSEAALTSTVKLARRALRHGDVRESEGLGIKAVHGRGFRFVGDVRSGGPDSSSNLPDSATAAVEVDTGFVGRSAELHALHAALQTASSKEAQTALVTGEAGIGKTSLVDIFIETARAKGVRILRGQSVEHFGRAEPYLPVLEAWSRLATAPDAAEILPQLRKVAPSWLALLPNAGATEPIGASAATGDRTAGRMLREMADALEMVSRSRPLILALEDVHWSDRATIDLITYLAQRRSQSHLLLIATYRPSEMSETGSTVLDLARDIGGRGHGVELRLSPLERAESQAYLRHRLAGGDLTPELVQGLHERTDGHPLFLSNVVDVALRAGAITRVNGHWALADEALSLVPDDLRKIIDRQVESLDTEDRLLLEAASAAGAEFSVAALPPAVNQPLEQLEERCEALAWQERFLEDVGIDEWPDGTVAGRYRFIHTLYVDALYGRLPSARRVRIHRAIGERLEQGFAGRSEAVCGELAIHFEKGRDITSSIAYRRESARIAAARHANREAMIHLNAAIALLPEIDENERPRLELDLLLELVRRERSARIIDHSNLSSLYDSIERALTLTRELGTDEEAVQLLVANATLLQLEGRTADAVAAATKALERSEHAGSDVALTQAHAAVGKTLQQAGWLPIAEEHHRKALALYDPDTHQQHMTEYGEIDPAVASSIWLASILLARGLADSALALRDEAVGRAVALEHPLSLAWAHLMSAIFFLSLADPVRARESLTLSQTISTREAFDGETVSSGLADGWQRLVVGQAIEAVPVLEQARREYQAARAMSLIPICQAVLGTAYAFTGHPEAAERSFEEALDVANRTEQPLIHGNVLRTRANVLGLLGSMSAAHVEEALLPSMADARDRGDLWGALSAAVQIARSRLERHDPEGARAVLGPIAAEIEEGHDLPIMLEATGLLRLLGRDLDG